ncbi:MAG: PIN domain-containing protein [Treponema sp.]|jgi:predicted nucleic acid-binding protein|nr:PIN domain-containing protein [Treponema sp.]
MTLLIDTNVILDIIEKREPFFQASFAVIQQAVVSKHKSLFCASSVKDIFYLVKRHTGSIEIAKTAVTQLLTLVHICDTTADDIKKARALAMTDFEDAVLVATGVRENADCIISRNIKDFTNSPN